MAGRNRLQETERDILNEIYEVAVKPPERDRLSAPRTLARLQQKFPGRVDHWAKDRVSRLIADLKKRYYDTPRLQTLNSAFKWHRLADYDLPWEASQFLLEMQTWFEEWYSEWSRETRAGSEEGYPDPVFTVHEAQWSWRIHLAAPDLDLFKNWTIAHRFMIHELRATLRVEPPDMEALEGYLRYGEWRSEDHRNRYHKAIQEGRVRPLPEEKVGPPFSSGPF